MRRVSLIIGVLAIGLAIAGYVFFNGERRAPVRYRTVPVERGTIVSLVTATGTINPITDDSGRQPGLRHDRKPPRRF